MWKRLLSHILHLNMYLQWNIESGGTKTFSTEFKRGKKRLKEAGLRYEATEHFWTKTGFYQDQSD